MKDKGISIILAFLIILGIIVSSVTVFASGIAVGDKNPEMGDNGQGIHITEVFYDTPGLESKEEWVELYNPTNSEIDISGLILRDNSNSWNLPFSTVINARSTIIIARNETGFRNLYGVDPDVSGMTLALKNDGDILSLMDGNVIIVEVYPDTYIPGDTAGEFVRIHNPTENSINLGGWQITDREGVITFPVWASIGAGASLYLAYNASIFYDDMLQKADFKYGAKDSGPTPDMDKEKWGRGFKLSDKGDEVILKNDGDEIIDVVIYGNSDYTGVGCGWNGNSVKGMGEGIILERDRNETTGKYEDTDSAADWDDYRIYVVGQSHFPYVTFSFNGTVTVFTSPDSSFRELANAIENAEESIYVNLYQFHNFYLMDHLIDAINRSVNVKVLLEG
ncbi:MAG: lamin tail domain-containing protein, partial [Methanophagales archaeon]|nr:lamin tail domain-containing protein [Methanophagales archaeon]